MGVGTGPDQFFVGGHLDIGPLTSNISFRPNLEVGVGDGQTTVAFNAEFVYWFDRRRAPWRLYVGGGPALIVYRFNAGREGDAHSDVRPGLNVLIGLAHARGLFSEFKVGLIDSPELKFTLGYSFR